MGTRKRENEQLPTCPDRRSEAKLPASLCSPCRQQRSPELRLRCPGARRRKRRRAGPVRTGHAERAAAAVELRAIESLRRTEPAARRGVMEIGTEISRKIRVRPWSGESGKPGLGARAVVRSNGDWAWPGRRGLVAAGRSLRAAGSASGPSLSTPASGLGAAAASESSVGEWAAAEVAAGKGKEAWGPVRAALGPPLTAVRSLLEGVARRGRGPRLFPTPTRVPRGRRSAARPSASALQSVCFSGAAFFTCIFVFFPASECH